MHARVRYSERLLTKGVRAMAITTAPAPIPHNEYDPACYGCWFGRGVCSTVCSVCGCTWSTDDTGEPNRRSEACPDCPEGCHEWAFADARWEAAQ